MMWKIFLFTVLAAVISVGVSGMVGGLSNVSVDDEGVQNALNFAVAQINRRSNDKYLHKVSEVISAQRQLVAGMKYVITVKMARSTCTKGNANEECAIHTDVEQAQPYQCKFTVWSRPWNGDIKLLDDKC